MAVTRYFALHFAWLLLIGVSFHGKARLRRDGVDEVASVPSACSA